MAETKTLTAQCYCKAVHFTVTLPTTALPLPVHLCHCDICRYTHGTLCIFHAVLPDGIQPQFVAPSSRAALTGYVHSQAASERLFCRTCGCHIGDEDIESDPDTGKKEWRVASSIFSDHSSSFQLRSHAFVNAAADGGLHQWLPKIGDLEMRKWHPAVSKVWPIPPAEPPRQEYDDQGGEVIRAQCHCAGVSFTIARPTRPECVNSPHCKEYVSPEDPTKWSACLDACDDCRLMNGTHVLAWTFVPLALTQPRIKSDLQHGTLVTYRSSPSVLRAFCGVCGATVFFSCDERTPSEDEAVVDVAVGILRAPEGPLAERWLTWRAGRVAWEDSAKRFDQAFAESLARGHANWGQAKYGKSLTYNIG